MSTLRRETYARYRDIGRAIGYNISYFRKSKRLRQQTLSDRTGYTVEQLAAWEAGYEDVPLLALIRIGKAMRIPYERLLVPPSRLRE